MKTEVDYVAVPSKMVSKKFVDVVYNGCVMTINSATSKVKTISFNDKYGRGRYTLNYYQWQPIESLFGIS